MLQPNLLSLIIISMVWLSWWALNGVVSDPQTNLLRTDCTPAGMLVLPSSSIFSANVNETFRDIREQIVSTNKHFATAEQGHTEDVAFSLFQCRNYLSVHDCVGCFDTAAKEVRNCPADSPGGLVVYDGCFLGLIKKDQRDGEVEASREAEKKLIEAACDLHKNEVVWALSMRCL